MKKVVIATDSYKESMSGLEVAANIEQGFKTEFPDCEYIKLAMADGGEGTVNSLVESTNGQIVKCSVQDPLGREIESYFGLSSDREVAFIEMATASGLELLSREERNPMLTSTYGTGQLIMAALETGVKHLIIGIGGSATNDGGFGMAAALGVKFYDSNDQLLEPSGANLGKISKVDTSSIDSRIADVKFEVACDVDNTLCGDNGASHVFGPQKGADSQMVADLETNMQNYAQVIKDATGTDLNSIVGGGAAGGLGAGLAFFVNAELRSGVEIVGQYLELDKHIAGADLVITGEGRMDSQSVQGKAPIGVCKVASRYNVPTIAICGSLDPSVEIAYEHDLTAAFSVVQSACTLDEAFAATATNLQVTSRAIARLCKVNFK